MCAVASNAATNALPHLVCVLGPSRSLNRSHQRHEQAVQQDHPCDVHFKDGLEDEAQDGELDAHPVRSSGIGCGVCGCLGVESVGSGLSSSAMGVRCELWPGQSSHTTCRVWALDLGLGREISGVGIGCKIWVWVSGARSGYGRQGLC
eukprot:353696-Chlamydomonas_euryale.AAC.4